MNTKDQSGIVIVIRMKLINTAGKQNHNFNWDHKKGIGGKAGKFLGRSKKPYVL